MLKERLNVFRVEGSSFFDSFRERICSAQDFSVVWLRILQWSLHADEKRNGFPDPEEWALAPGS